MTATYERQGFKWMESNLKHLCEVGQATYFPGPDVYVVKRAEGGSVAVRPDQIIRDVRQELAADNAPEAELATEENLFAQALDEMAAKRPARSVSNHVHFSAEADALIAQFTKKGLRSNDL